MPENAMHLYFIGAEGLDFVKVGRSKHPQSRLRQLRGSSPYKLRLLRTYEYAGDLERFVLAALRARVEMNGEWFLSTAIDFDLLVENARQEFVEDRKVLLELQARKAARMPHKGLGLGLGPAMKQSRAALGWKQQDLQAATGISQKYLSRVENDKADPSWSIVQRIAEVLSLDLNAVRRQETPR